MKILTTSVLPPTHPYLINKYTLWYYSIIDYARQRDTINEYTETHHIIPDCFYINNRSKGKRPGFLIGNSNDKNNLVNLTFREHFICHWLLTKMVEGPLYYKMERAMTAIRFGKNNTFKITTTGQYQRSKIAARNAQIGLPSRSKGKSSIKKGKKFGPQTNPFTGIRISANKGKSLGKWYNNGIEETYGHSQPDGYVCGRLPMGKRNFGYKWFNNGNVQTLAKNAPDGFVPGRLKKPCI